MTAPTRNGGHGIVWAVATEALGQAEDLEKEAADMEMRASDKRRAASVLRQLHAIAAPNVQTGEAA